MATVTTASIIERAGILLDDMTHVGWTEDELLKWLNDGQREIVHFKPEANSKTMIVSKVAGTKQTLPSDGVALIDISRNFAADGTTPGRAVRPVKRAQLDKNLPDWHNAAATLDALHYTYDRQNPKVFYVYPPSNAVGKLEIIYGASPADATLVSTISIDDTWQTALLNYMVFRCLSKEAEAGMAAAATGYYNAFVALVGGKSSAEMNTDPNADMKSSRATGA